MAVCDRAFWGCQGPACSARRRPTAEPPGGSLRPETERGLASGRARSLWVSPVTASCLVLDSARSLPLGLTQPRPQVWALHRGPRLCSPRPHP